MRPLAILLLAILPACASAGAPAAPREGTDRHVVRIEGFSEVDLHEDHMVASSSLAAEPAQLWPVVLAVYGDFGLEINSLNADERVVGVENFRVRRIAGARPSRYLDCGHSLSGANADRDDIFLSMLTHLVPAAGGGTELRTQVRAQSKNTMHGGGAQYCRSNGRLEQEFADAVAARMAAAGG